MHEENKCKLQSLSLKKRQINNGVIDLENQFTNFLFDRLIYKLVD